MKKGLITLSCATLCGLGLVSLSFAAELSPSQSLAMETYKGIPYVSGGIGVDERATLRARGKEDNLKLTFALEDGHYLGDAAVLITDATGHKVLEALSQGPWFLAKLPAGTYTVRATALGKTFLQVVQVPVRGQKQVHFAWPLAALKTPNLPLASKGRTLSSR